MMEDSENKSPKIMESPKSVNGSFSLNKSSSPVIRLALKEVSRENGNICERGQGPALEVLTAKSSNGETITASPTQPPEQPTVQPNLEKEEDHSQGLTDSISFASLNTLSTVSETALNTAVSEQSRPKSADTDSLDYESADEAVSLKAETPAEEEEEDDEPAQLNETLGLDALTNKLATLYINSPNPSIKPPAFHTDSLSSAYVQSRLDDTDSDISFSASFVEVIGHDSVTQASLEQSKSEAEVTLEEENKAPEEEEEAEKPVETVQPEPVVAEEPRVPAAETPASLEQSKSEAETTLEEESQAPQETPEAEKPVETVQPEPVVVEEAEAPAAKEEPAAPVEEPAAESEPVQEKQPEEQAAPVVESIPPQLVVPEVQAVEEQQLEESSPIKEQVVQESVEVKDLDTPSPEQPTKEVEQTESPLPIVVNEEVSQIKPLAEEADFVALAEKFESASIQQAPAETPEPKETLPEIVSEALVEKLPEEPQEPSKEESPSSENQSIVEVQLEQLQIEEEKVLEVEPAAIPVHTEQLIAFTPVKVLETPKPKDEPAIETPQVPVAEKEEQLPVESLPEPVIEANKKPVAEVAPVSVVADVSFEEPATIISEPQQLKPVEVIKSVQIEVNEISAEHIPKEKPNFKFVQSREFEPEKEVSVEKPFEERKVSSAPLFIQHRGLSSPHHSDPLITSTGSLSELLDICKKQQSALDDDEVDTPVVEEEEEETNELEQFLAAEANLICQELNASFDTTHDAMSELNVPVTAPRRSRSPRKPSPARIEEDDPFKTKSRFANSPIKDTLAAGMEGNGSPMSSSGESAIASSRITMGKSTDSTSPKSMLSMDSGICGAYVNHSEAGPETASEEHFMPATEDLFKDPSAFDFLSKIGGNQDSAAARLERESLYVKFDPLVGNRDRRVFLSPCVEASPRSEDVETSPPVAPARAPKSETPLTSRHAVGPLVQIATPLAEDTPVVVKRQSASEAKSQNLAEGQALQEMIILLKRESEELKKLADSQRNDYEAKLSAMQSKFKQKTEAEDQMSLVMKEYEDTISRILAEKEKALEKAGEEKQRLSEEVAIVQSDLSAAEVAFSDLHRKYERAKNAIEVFKANENTLKQSNIQFQEQIKQAEKRYIVLKTHAEDKLEEAARENDALVKTSELEMSALRAQNAQFKARNTTLVETLAMRERENQELMTICDDLVQKLGTQSH